MSEPAADLARRDDARFAAMREHIARLFDYVEKRQPRAHEREAAELSVAYLARYLDELVEAAHV